MPFPAISPQPLSRVPRQVRTLAPPQDAVAGHPRVRLPQAPSPQPTSQKAPLVKREAMPATPRLVRLLGGAVWTNLSGIREAGRPKADLRFGFIRWRRSSTYKAILEKVGGIRTTLKTSSKDRAAS